MIEFKPWPKTPRLFRDVVITEKIDGTNAAVHVVPLGGEVSEITDLVAKAAYAGKTMQVVWDEDGHAYEVGAQSRNRLITPDADNAGFARWVEEHAGQLAQLLGPGTHYGEWWGYGIQRGYGLPKGEKRFSLFNVDRHKDSTNDLIGLHVVPTLYRGPFDTEAVEDAVTMLRQYGSQAAPGFMRPEGVVVYHTAAGHGFKVLIENDNRVKGARAELHLDPAPVVYGAPPPAHADADFDRRVVPAYGGRPAYVVGGTDGFDR